MILLFLYQLLFILIMPLWLVIFGFRLMKGKEDKKRFKERFGFAGRTRPKGDLIWMHGASVGECLSMLSLIQKLLENNPHLSIMVTSGTTTSAALMQKRLPKRAFHHYLPLDAPGFTRRLIRFFKPKAVLWFESEFWPTTLAAFQQEKVPLVLLNGRVSDRSFVRWQKHPFIIRQMLSCFSAVLGQSEEDRRRLEVLGGAAPACVGNLKCAATASPFDAKELASLLAQIGVRPAWVMASTHGPEEEMMVQTMTQLREKFPQMITICAPRHPQRATELVKMFSAKGFQVARRSLGQEIHPETEVYLADTLGEMGLIYQLAPVVFVGGSLIPFGGQNMLEPMYWSRVVLVGPHTQNFRAFMKKGKENQTVIEVPDATALAQQIAFYWTHEAEQRAMRHRAHEMAVSEMAVLDRVVHYLKERGIE